MTGKPCKAGLPGPQELVVKYLQDALDVPRVGHLPSLSHGGRWDSIHGLVHMMPVKGYLNLPGKFRAGRRQEGQAQKSLALLCFWLSGFSSDVWNWEGQAVRTGVTGRGWKWDTQEGRALWLQRSVGEAVSLGRMYKALCLREDVEFPHQVLEGIWLKNEKIQDLLDNRIEMGSKNDSSGVSIFRRKSGGSGETSLGGLVTIKMGRTRMKSKRILKSQSRKPADLCRNSSASDFWSWELSLTTVPRNVAIKGYPAHSTKKKIFMRLPLNIWLWCFQTKVSG